MDEHDRRVIGFQRQRLIVGFEGRHIEKIREAPGLFIVRDDCPKGMFMESLTPRPELENTRKSIRRDHTGWLGMEDSNSSIPQRIWRADRPSVAVEPCSRGGFLDPRVRILPPQPAGAVSPIRFPAARELPTFPRVMLACPSLWLANSGLLALDPVALRRSARHFPISISAYPRPVRYVTETGFRIRKSR